MIILDLLNQFHTALFPVSPLNALGAQLPNLAEDPKDEWPTLREEYGRKDDNGVYIATSVQQAIDDDKILAARFSDTQMLLVITWTHARITHFHNLMINNPGVWDLAPLRYARNVLREYETRQES
jgi:hypothetical protein